MKLTPVKVKGKAGQKKTWRPPCPPRPVKRQRDEDDDGADDSNDRSRRKAFKSKHPAAPIEELPTEILERIIFMCRNLNFLRSSLRLGYRFSSPSFLVELVRAAFAPTWDMWCGHTRDEAIHHDYLSHHAAIQGDPEFQGAVLACPWASVSLILEAQQRWCRRSGGPGRLAERVRLPAPPLPPPSHLSPSDVVPRFEKDWEAFETPCRAFFSSADPYPDILLTRAHLEDGRYIELHPLTPVPQRLLTGPFDWEAARLLFWYVRAGARLPREHTWTWELTRRGYGHIVALGDKPLALAVFLLLDKLCVFDHWPEFLVGQELDEVARRVESSEDLTVRQLGWGIYEVLESQTNSRQAKEAIDKGGPRT